MKRRWKQIGSLFLVVCMVITMLPMTAFAYPGPVSGNMNIDGKTGGFDLAKDADNLTSRGWAWEAATATLRLTENYEGDPIEILPSGDGDVIKLVYTGNVTITNAEGVNGIECGGDLVIDSNGGTLSVESSSRAISVTKNLYIEKNASVVATSSGSYAIACQGNLNLRGSLTANCDVEADIIVNGGTVNINGDLSRKLTVSAGQVTVTGDVDDGILNTGGTVWVNGEQIFAPALFCMHQKPAKTPSIWGK